MICRACRRLERAASCKSPSLTRCGRMSSISIFATIVYCTYEHKPSGIPKRQTNNQAIRGNGLKRCCRVSRQACHVSQRKFVPTIAKSTSLGCKLLSKALQAWRLGNMKVRSANRPCSKKRLCLESRKRNRSQHHWLGPLIGQCPFKRETKQTWVEMNSHAWRMPAAIANPKLPRNDPTIAPRC